PEPGGKARGSGDGGRAYEDSFRGQPPARRPQGLAVCLGPTASQCHRQACLCGGTRHYPPTTRAEGSAMKRSAFTLVEAMVVIAVIVLLLALLLASGLREA